MSSYASITAPMISGDTFVKRMSEKGKRKGWRLKKRQFVVKKIQLTPKQRRSAWPGSTALPCLHEAKVCTRSQSRQVPQRPSLEQPIWRAAKLSEQKQKYQKWRLCLLFTLVTKGIAQFTTLAIIMAIPRRRHSFVILSKTGPAETGFKKRIKSLFKKLEWLTASKKVPDRPRRENQTHLS